MKRIAAWCCYVLLVLIGWLGTLVAWLAHVYWGGVDPTSRAFRAALLFDLMVAALMGAEPGETVSTYMARLRPTRPACWFCSLLAVQWPTHCDDAAGVYFDLVKRADPQRM